MFNCMAAEQLDLRVRELMPYDACMHDDLRSIGWIDYRRLDCVTSKKI